jgi:hypothetical protein
VRTARRILSAQVLSALCIGLAAARPSLAGPWDGVNPAGPWASGSVRRQDADATRLWAQAPGTAADNPSATQARRAPRSTEAIEPAPWYGANNVHKYLGLGSIALAGLTLLSPKEENGPHEYFARGAAALGVAAVATGIYAHWEDVDARWSNPDTQHAVLGALGALGILAAVAKGGKGDHAAYGGIGAVSMAVAIKLEW